MKSPKYLMPFFAAIFIYLCIPAASKAASDTVFVHAFSFGSKQDSTILFPPAGQYRKVLMYYTLKCNPAQNPACGQWDYLTYTYLYQHTGIYDSVVGKIDSIYNKNTGKYVKDTLWKKVEKLNRFELGRYITPYGINLSLGNGFTWTYDVTDYLPLLHDSVHLSAGNWQELLDLKFAFIKGTPARKPYKVENVWTGNYNYGGNPDMGTQMGTKSIITDPNAAYTKMVIRVTGHGEDGSNCAEFCPENHFLNVDGTQRWTQYVWRDNCAYNPIIDQGGTWLYQRANWCPGAEVKTYAAELTPFVSPGKSASYAYSADAYTTTSSSSGNSNPYYNIEAQLISYGTANFKLDAAVENILSPTMDNMFGHNNPVCSNPQIIIKNNGTTTLTSLTIKYGRRGGNLSTYHWVGDLNFLDVDTVTLGQFDWADGAPPLVFEASVSNPNGAADEYAADDTMYSYIPVTKTLPYSFIIQTKTNSSASENAYTLTDQDGAIVYQRNNMANNTLYRDTVKLQHGCYTFRFTDSNQDGLYFFANTAQGTGSLRLTTTAGKNIIMFNPDFGAEVLMNFNVGYGLGIEPQSYPQNIDVFPNPSSGSFSIDATSLEQNPCTLQVFDLVGKLVMSKTISGIDDHLINVNLSSKPAGIYIVNVATAYKTFTQKIVLTK